MFSLSNFVMANIFLRFVLICLVFFFRKEIDPLIPSGEIIIVPLIL